MESEESQKLVHYRSLPLPRLFHSLNHWKYYFRVNESKMSQHLNCGCCNDFAHMYIYPAHPIRTFSSVYSLALSAPFLSVNGVEVFHFIFNVMYPVES